MAAIVTIRNLAKTYGSGHVALSGVDLDVEEGEILALLGPNGAGKTTLISIVCGIVTPSGGRVAVAGHDVVKDFRASRRLVGLVPQELALEPFETVIDTVRFSRGLFGKPRDDGYLERLLTDLSLWEKRAARAGQLSGGMKRRLLIAKALGHEPRVLFLDEPTAGVDVELRKDMWRLLADLKRSGVTIILTTHYLEEAEALADRIAIIDRGTLVLVEEKTRLMRRLGRRELRIELADPLGALPAALAAFPLDLADGGGTIVYAHAGEKEEARIAPLLKAIADAGLTIRDVHSRQSSLEEIFVNLVGKNR